MEEMNVYTPLIADRCKVQEVVLSCDCDYGELSNLHFLRLVAGDRW